MKALVTGGCGFIGSNLVHQLVKDGWYVEIVDDLSSGNPYFLKGLKSRYIPNLPIAEATIDTSGDTVNVLTMDFAHRDVLSRVRSGLYDVIFHLAANPRVEYSVQNPTETTETNILKTVGLFECAAKAKIKRIVFSSTCAVYGDAAVMPTHEKSDIQPNSPYGLQKYTVEMFASLLSKTHNLESVCLRYFNVYGPRQFGGSPYSTAITSWTHNIFSGKELRSDGDGSQTRDLIYVDDVVRANILAATCKRKFAGSAYNIATGNSTSNSEILSYFVKEFDNVKVITSAWRPGDVMHTLASTKKSKKDLGFKSKISLDEGLNRTWNWWRKVAKDNEL